MTALKDALCTVDEQVIRVSPQNRADYAYGRAAAFLLSVELEIHRRMNIKICGSEITNVIE